MQAPNTVQIPLENVLQRQEVVPVPEAPAVTPNVPFPPLVVTTPLVVRLEIAGVLIAVLDLNVVAFTTPVVPPKVKSPAEFTVIEV